MTRRPLSSRASLAAAVGLVALLAPSVAIADTCNGLSLAALTPAPAGSNPVAVAVGDFNRDGKLDVVTANNGGNDVTVLLGDGTGGFTLGATISSGATSNPVDIVAGDINRDGFLDLVVAFGSSNQVRVLQGLSTSPWFSAAAPFDVAIPPSRLYLADFNRDGALDLVVVSEVGKRLHVHPGTGGTTFSTTPSADIDLSLPLPGELPSAAVPLDFNRDGRLDLAVVMRNTNLTRIYYGNGLGSLALGGPSAGTGPGPADIVAGDVNRDGWPDLVTANSLSANASVLLNSGGATPTLIPSTPAPVGGTPTRVALRDLNDDGVLDLVGLDASATPQMVGVLGLKTGPPFFQATPLYAAPLTGAPGGLAIGRFTADGRRDLVTALAVGPPGQVVVVENRSGTPCMRSSFPGARGFAAGDGPISTAAADFDRDGRIDLAVASVNDTRIRLLMNVPGDFVTGLTLNVAPATPTAVATADMNFDGNADVVAALDGASPTVQVFLGNGLGGLTPGSAQPIGSLPSAVVIGDFNGDGAPDVAAASETTGLVYVFMGDGAGGLAAGIPTAVGADPRALVTGYFNADSILDLAVANAGGNSVTILLGAGNGTFTPAVGSPVGLGAGIAPWGIAAADIDGDLDTDLVTANNGSGTVSVLRNTGGAFSLIASYAVSSNPTAVALLDLAGSPAPDIAVTSGADRTLQVLTNSGSGTFGSPADHPVRNFPRAITAFDADADGRLDLAVPCQTADSVVVLLARPPTLLEAPRVATGVHPHAVVAADLDGDGDLDLAVANQGVVGVADDSVSLLRNDGTGTFTPFPTPSYAVGQDPESIVAGDFNRDGRIDLALDAPGGATPSVWILFGAGAPGEFTAQPPVLLPAGAIPDELAVGDFDRDGDLDIAVCDKQPGTAGAVRILKNDGTGVFSLAATIANVGDKPTALVVGDFDRDGDLDIAVANASTTVSNIRILVNDGLGGFTLGAVLPLAGGDQGPVAITAGDFDGDGALDLAAAAFIGDRIHVYRNLGGGNFAAPVTFDTPATLNFVTAADFNLDGKPDLAVVAAGLLALRGKGALDFELPETWVAGLVPFAGAVGDFNGDGVPDVAVVNQDSNDASILLSTACAARRLEVSLQPLACGGGPPPYALTAETKAIDDGGNTATCAAGTVVPSIVPGTGDPLASLGGPVSGLPLVSGLASFTSGNLLTIDRPGRHYQLQFNLSGAPPAHSRSFTLGSTDTMLGPASICPTTFGLYSTAESYDTYAWSLDGAAAFAFTPSVSLTGPPLTGSHTLNVACHVDGCVASFGRSIYFGNLASVTLSPVGVNAVCVDCIGGTATAIELGGGTPVSRQWGYRTVTGGPITPITGETADTYTLKGTSFPGPGNYFVVVTTTPQCGSATISNEWTVTVSDDVPNGEVQHLAATSRGTGAAGGQNLLQWVNTAAPEEVRIRWTRAPIGTSACLSPASLAAPFDGEAVVTSPAPNAKDSYLHTDDGGAPGLTFDTAFCYSVFVKVLGVWSPGRTIKARPFNADSGPVKWSYSTGGTAVAPPTIGTYGILALSNDQTVHSLIRGISGGDWPTSWMPRSLQGVAHSRSPVVPFLAPLAGADWVLFVADDSPTGFVHALDAKTGGPVWPAPQAQGLPITGAPGGMFTQYSGIRDLIVVGTRDNTNPNTLRGLNLTDGLLAEAYAGLGSPGQVGPINGTPAIDYPTHRVYFASRKLGAGDTLFCLEIGDPLLPVPVFTWKWSRDLGNILGSPVLRNGRVYVGAESGIVYSLDALTGGDDRTFTPAPLDGPVKGFLFPDRRNNDLMFATNTKVWSIRDDGVVPGQMTKNWEWTTGGLNPSLILYWPETSYVFVGSANGTLFQLDFSAAAPAIPPTFRSQVLGDGTGQIGAPSLDIGVTPKLLVVGSESGALYGVQVPLP